MNLESQLLILMDVTIATVLTGIVGYERETVEKPAGLRTNMIIGGSSCLFVSLSPYLILFFKNSVNNDFINSDPIRVIQAIVVGVSFIGAGTILKVAQKSQIYYLTTAATLLYSSGIGIAVGIRLYPLAIGITLLIIIVNLVVKPLEKKQ